jgi:hypothetical protein
LYEDLPLDLGHSFYALDPLANVFEKYAQRTQKSGNCELLNPKTSVLALLAIQKLVAIDPKLFTRKALKIAYDQAFKEAYDTYKQFSEFCRIQVLKEYLQFKVEEKKNNLSDAIPPDHSLVKSTIDKLHTKKYKIFFDETEIQSLLDQYQQVFPEYQEALPLPPKK